LSATNGVVFKLIAVDGVFWVSPSCGFVGQPIAGLTILNGCSDSPEQSGSSSRSGPTPAGEVRRWTSCSGGHVVFHRIIGRQHATPPSVDIGRLLVDFFRSQSR
jgi:hypothetical protein